MTDISIKPLRGVHRDVNPLVAPVGSMREAQNVVFRTPGALEPIGAVQTLADLGAQTSVYRILDFGTYLLVVFNSGGTAGTRWVQVSNGAVTTALLPSSFVPTYETGVMQGAKYRDRCYFTSKQGLICGDTPGDTTLRKAGLPPPSYSRPVVIGGAGIAASLAVNLCAVFRRDFADGTSMRSPPSIVTKFVATGSGNSIQHTVYWNTGLEMAADDLIEIYRTESVDSSVDPGATFYRTKVYKLTSTDITNRYAQFNDGTDDDGLGEALYTNAGQVGAERAYFPPPHLKDIVSHRGTMMAIATQERYSLTFRVPHLWGSLDSTDERTYGIGQRLVTGQVVSGSAAITSVSATHMLGIVAGQRLECADFPITSKVLTATGTTITMDTVASSDSFGGSAATDLLFLDRLEINGTEFDARMWWSPASGGMLQNFWTATFPYTITLDQSIANGTVASGNRGLGVALARHYAGSENTTFTLRATNGQNYAPNLPLITETAISAGASVAGNRLAYCEANLPDSWPLLNRLYIGDGDLVRLLHVGDAIYALNTDGRIYRISGSGRSWRSDQVADGFLPLASLAAASNGRVGYFWSDAGFVKLSEEGGAQIVSAGKIDNDLRADLQTLGTTTPWTWSAGIGIDRLNRRTFLHTGTAVWIYDEDADEFTQYVTAGSVTAVTAGAGSFCYSANLAAVVMGFTILGTTYVKRYPAIASPLYFEATTLIQPNRTDLGLPANVKLWDSVVFAMAFDTVGSSQPFLFTASGDDDCGGADVSAVTETVTPVSGLGRHARAPVGLAASMSTQVRFKLATTQASTSKWRIEDIIYRFRPSGEGGARNDP